MRPLLYCGELPLWPASAREVNLASVSKVIFAFIQDPENKSGFLLLVLSGKLKTVMVRKNLLKGLKREIIDQEGLARNLKRGGYLSQPVNPSPIPSPHIKVEVIN